jgi:hypothetical protein
LRISSINRANVVLSNLIGWVSGVGSVAASLFSTGMLQFECFEVPLYQNQAKMEANSDLGIREINMVYINSSGHDHWV